MRWPWTRHSVSEQLVVSWSGQVLSYVQARALEDGRFHIVSFGVVARGTDSDDAWMNRLEALDLKGHSVRVMLRPEQYQWLQIDAPAVPPEEMRAAARFQVREMLQTHVDDVTLDVMRVGGVESKVGGSLFVVAATNVVLRDIQTLGETMDWDLGVIDVQETAQRNLQSALAARDGRADRANAALVLMEGHPAVLTITANEEIFYARRFDLPPDFLAHAWSGDRDQAALSESFTPVGEYVPEYSVDGVSYGADYSQQASPGLALPADDEDDIPQRFLLEVQRSLDVWERSWSKMALANLRVYAGQRSEELAQWLAAQLGQPVEPMKVGEFFPGFEGGSMGEQALCMPLLGVLLRPAERKS